MQLILLFATNEPLPRGCTVIFFAFLTIFGQNSPNKWPKNGLFLAIGKSWKYYMVGARDIFVVVDDTMERSPYEYVVN